MHRHRHRRGALYLTKAVKTASASAQVDGNGGMHAAYVHYVPAPDPSPAVYAFCAPPTARCADAATWSSVQLADDTRDVQLQLTPAGQPRLLIVARSTVYPNGKDYLYAACDSACSEPSRWSVVRVASSDGTATIDFNDEAAPQRSFALDPQGRPRFVYQDLNYGIEPDHYGAYYVQCDTDCTVAAHWQQTRISREYSAPYRYDYEIFDYPSLTFTTAGQPRVVANVIAINEDGSDAPDGLYYFACDTHCDTMAGWQRRYLFNQGSGSMPLPTSDFELDAANHPHIAMFTGGAADGGLDYQLIYLTCSGDCLQATNWKGAAVGVPVKHGQTPDIEIDHGGRPRIAYMTYNGDLGYAWCNAGCTAGESSWQSRTIETVAAMEAANPQAIPFTCDQPVWHGATPTLALDGAGNPRIAHDVLVDARCLYRDPDDPSKIYYQFERAWNGVRWHFFPQP